MLLLFAASPLAAAEPAPTTPWVVAVGGVAVAVIAVLVAWRARRAARAALAARGDAQAATTHGQRLVDDLARARERAEALSDHDLIGVLTTGTDGRISSANVALARLLGVAADALVGRRWRDLLRAEDIAADDRALRDLAEGNAATPYAAWCQREDGELIPVRVARRRVADGAIAIVVDLAGQHRAEVVAQQQSAERLALVEALPDALLLVRGGRITTANPAAVALFGSDVIGRDAAGLLDESVAVGANPSLLRVGNREFMVTAMPGHDAGDRLLLLRDQSERVRAEVAAAAAEQRFLRLAEATSVGIWQFDHDGKTRFANPAMLGLLGVRQAAELDGRAMQEFLTPESVQALGRERTRRGDGRPWSHEADLISTGGERRHVLVCAAPLSGQDAGAGVIATVLDLKDRRVLEEQLRQAQKMEAIGRLSGGLASDFNNLLTVISGYGELHLKNLASNDPRRKSVEQMLKATKRAGSLTQQLLAVSRQQVLTPVVVDLNAVISELDGMLRRLLGDRIRLTVRPGPDLGRIKVDRNQLEQVMLNLVVNARDAMPDGGTLLIETDNVELDEIYTRLQPSARPGSCVMLSVADTGVGMDAETQARVFEPFFTTKDASQGAGMGLATVYGIVQALGGNIWFTSAPDKGTVFKVYFPLVEGEGATQAPPPSPAVAGRSSETILLVEDEVDVRELIAEMLGGEGYRIIEAANGKEGLARFRELGESVHLVLTDVVMPQMNGPELGEELERLKSGTRVLYMSGYLDRVIVRSDVNDPSFLFLEKPFTAAALLRKVREALDRPAKA